MRARAQVEAAVRHIAPKHQLRGGWYIRAWGPDEVAMRQLTREGVLQAVRELPPRLGLVLELRFGLLDHRPRTLEEVGREIGVTRERVRQIELQALEKLKNASTFRALLAG